MERDIAKKRIIRAVIVVTGIFLISIFIKKNEKVDRLAETENTEFQEIILDTENDLKTETQESRYTLPTEFIYDMRLDAESVEDYYIKIKAGGRYTIDEDGVLWGRGPNDYGQLGLGHRCEGHNEKVKMAENVVHVDSANGFVIWLTDKGELYGVGNDSYYNLYQHTEFLIEDYNKPEEQCVTNPVLLLENVSYARCGYTDVVALKKDGTVWTWGLVWKDCNGDGYAKRRPKQILSGVKFITGGLYNHAALKEDGTVWTWGDNDYGNCGSDKADHFSEPQMVADNVVRVWTGSLNYSSREIDKKDPGYSLEYESTNAYSYKNTIIEKKDGTFYACGIIIDKEKSPIHYGLVGAYIFQTGEFVQLDWNEAMLNKAQKEFVFDPLTKVPGDIEPDEVEYIRRYAIPEQTFDVYLEDWGNVTFVTCERSLQEEYASKDVKFYLVKGDQVLYKFPYRYKNNYTGNGGIGRLEEVKAIAFRDINRDGKKDVIIISHYFPSMLDNYICDVRVHIYVAEEKSFRCASEISEDIEENVDWENITIDRVCNYLNSKE